MAKKNRTPEQLAAAALARPVIVRWVDASGGPSGWTRIDYIHDKVGPEPVESIGYVLKDDKDQILLVQSIGGTDVDNVMAIPKTWVLGIWEIDTDE